MATLIELEWISTERKGNQRLVLPVCRSSRVEVRSTGYPPASMHLCTYVYTLFGVTYALARRKRDAPAGAPTQQKGGSPQDICRQQHNTKAGASSRGVERSTTYKEQAADKAEGRRQDLGRGARWGMRGSTTSSTSTVDSRSDTPPALRQGFFCFPPAVLPEAVRQGPSFFLFPCVRDKMLWEKIG
jgi:hypothetical protein